MRDLLRKRGQLVRQRSTQILSMGNLLARNLGSHASGNEIKHWQPEQIDAMALLDEQKLAMKANLAVMRCLDVQVKALEHSILVQGQAAPGLPDAQDRQRHRRCAGTDHCAGDRRCRPL